MKKLFLTSLIVLGLGTSAFAQGRGLFDKGPGEQSSYNNRDASGLVLPTVHGNPGDQPANDGPLGCGVLLLAGLGAAYAVSKRRKE